MVAIHSPDGASNDRLAPDPCKYRETSAESLDAMLAATGGQARWHITSVIAWTTMDEWLSPIPSGETSIRLELLPTSVTSILLYVPGVDDPSTCPPWAEFSAEITVRTDDAVIDTHASGSFIVKRGRMTGRFRMDMPPTVPPEPDTVHILSVLLDIPSNPDAAAVIEVHGGSVRISARGYGTLSGSSDTLAVSIASPR